MNENELNHRTTISILQDEFLLTQVETFLIDKKTQGLAPRTLVFYQQKLENFLDYCERKEITLISQITPNELRLYLLELEQAGHNAGGRHAFYRSIRTFLNWYELEEEPDNWKNPIKRVKAPKLPTEPIEPVSLDEVAQLMTAANGSKWIHRDKALIMALLDTGARAAEFVAMNLDDLNLMTGAILIRKGKGSKPRTVYIGKKTRRFIRAYLKTRTDENAALWTTQTGTRLTQSGLRQVLRRLAERANIKEPGAHDFRRAFALNMLRNGIDLYTLARLMGHADIQVLKRYLAQTDEDSREAHSKFGFVDNL